MARYFTLSECQELLPRLEQPLRQAVFHHAEHRKADQELNHESTRVRISGGARVDRGAWLALRARRDQSAAALKQALEQIEQIGALVKDLEIGLLDFLSLHRGREIFLCWRLGEDRIRFWHGIDEGFRGRKPIDDKFLKADE